MKISEEKLTALLDASAEVVLTAYMDAAGTARVPAEQIHQLSRALLSVAKQAALAPPEVLLVHDMDRIGGT
jgi:hypothetical protein